MNKTTTTLLAALLFFACESNTQEIIATDNTQENTTNDSEQVHEDPLIETFTFVSKDSLLMTATSYQNSETSPWILLCHQARWSRGEYQETALKFLSLGFNCIAIDQRSGGEINAVANQTYTRAQEADLGTDYLDAEQDIEAAIDYLFEKTGAPIILLGSSYSSTLACYQGIRNDKVMAWISFSPGNYFAEDKGDLMPLLSANEKPFWLTSSNEEATELSAMLKTTTLDELHVQFVPQGEGEHGSRALWEEKPDHEEYWESLIPFLNSLKTY